MTYEAFRVKYEGKAVDFDGYYGNQCMDLYRQYCKECLEVPQSPPVNGAKDVWNTYLTEYFDRYLNELTAVPQQGDILIWGVGVGPYEHIAIYDNGDVNKFKSFDQNWPVNSLCHLQDHNYNGVLGWLRKKVNIPLPPQTPSTIDLGGLQTPLETYGVIEMETLKSKLLAKDTDLKNKEDRIFALLDKTTEYSNLLEEKETEILGMRMEINKLNKVKEIIWGKGWVWDRMNKLKVLLPH